MFLFCIKRLCVRISYALIAVKGSGNRRGTKPQQVIRLSLCVSSQPASLKWCENAGKSPRAWIVVLRRTTAIFLMDTWSDRVFNKNGSDCHFSLLTYGRTSLFPILARHRTRALDWTFRNKSRTGKDSFERPKQCESRQSDKQKLWWIAPTPLHPVLLES